MAEILKTFAIALDTKAAQYKMPSVLVEGDTGNRFVITLTDDGVAVDLSSARVAVVFSGPMGTAMQDSWTGTGDVTISGASHNIITVDVHNGSYATGLITCEVQVYSGTSYETLVTSSFFTFNAKKPILNDSTIQSADAYPTLVYWAGVVKDLTDREQSDWTQTDNTKGNYIQNKPVAGTDFQSPTQTLTAETTLADADTVPFYDASATAHRKSTWANIVSTIRTLFFGTSNGILKANGSGVISAAVSNTDYASATHASRHASGAADAVSPASIGAEKERLPFTDQSVSTSNWATYTAIGTEETKIYNKGYTYKKPLALTGVLATMKAYIIPSEDKDDCGTTICNTVITYDGGINIYAKATPTAAFVLLSIDCFKAVG